MSYSVREEDFESIQTEWEQMLPACSTNTIFLTPWWQRVWWRRFGEGWELRILSVWEDDKVLGIAPLMARDGVMSFVGGTDLFDYHDFIVPQGKEALFFDSLCDYLIKLDWRRLDLTSLPQGSPTLRHLPSLAEKKGIAVEVVEEDMTPIASLPSTWDDYLSGLTKKNRHELRRKLRRLERADGAHQYVCDNPDSLVGCMQDFFSLHKASSPDKMGFLTPERESFFEDIALELAPRGQFKLYFLEISDTRVASCICFDYADSYLLYNSGYHPDFSSLSVGLLNKALCIKEAIEEGRRSFEFLRGSERYKYELGGKDQAIYQMRLSR